MQKTPSPRVWLVLLAVCGTFCEAGHGQVPVAAQPADADQVQLNFPNDIEISTFVDYVSQRLQIRILYDEKVANKKISIRSPGPIPASSLEQVLASALRMKGLVLADAGGGWKRILDASSLPSVAEPGVPAADQALPVTQVFVLVHINPEPIDQLIKSFLTAPGANSVVLAESKMLIVTDYPDNLRRVSRLIELVDKPRSEVSLRFQGIEHVPAAELAKDLEAILQAKSRVQGGDAAKTPVEILPEPRTNRLLMIGPADQVAEAIKLIETLDVSLGLETRTYRFEDTDAKSVDELMRGLIGPLESDRVYHATIDEAENALIVTASPEIHAQLAAMRRGRGAQGQPPRSPIRFYKIKNLPVTEVLATLRAIEQGMAVGVDQGLGDEARSPFAADGRYRPISTLPLPRPPVTQLPGLPFGRTGQQPQSGQGPRASDQGMSGAVNMPGEQAPPLATAAEGTLVGPESVLPGDVRTQSLFEPASRERSPALDYEQDEGWLIGRARLSADVHTNTIIVVAEPPVQKLYAELIEKLDQRRPQVLIEAQLVILDTSDDFSLGIEFAVADSEGAKRALAFTSFGLSEVNPVTGALAIIPGLGFNGTLIDADTADVVLRTLTSHRRARVVSSPRILVNDNSTGRLSSVAEVPFTSVNASNTVATTSFAGFAEAGTTVTVTPRISDDDHLQLDFTITLNNFTGTGAAGVPPPRQTDEVTSQITIPDGHTVIVGGIHQRNDTYELDSLPVIDKIPILKYLGGSETVSGTETSMFIFIKPIILRDDKFRALKYLSGRDRQAAKIQHDLPESGAIWLK